MELPANPNRLSLTGYDEYGRPISEEEEKMLNKSGVCWQLSDDSEDNSPEYDQTNAFGIEGGWF